jgi:antitoxin VapB
MDGSQPVRITREGGHQVVHLPIGVTVPADAVVRQEGERLIIEQAGLPLGSVERLLAVLATMERIEERLGPINDPQPEPVAL